MRYGIKVNKAAGNAGTPTRSRGGSPCRGPLDVDAQAARQVHLAPDAWSRGRFVRGLEHHREMDWGQLMLEEQAQPPSLRRHHARLRSPSHRGNRPVAKSPAAAGRSETDILP